MPEGSEFHSRIRQQIDGFDFSWFITYNAMLCEVLKYKKDAKITDRITKSSFVHSTKKKLSRISRKMIGTQVWPTNMYVYSRSFFVHTKINST